jgi:hypothetical protein
MITMRGAILPVLLVLSACATAPVPTPMLSAAASQVFSTSSERSRLSIENKTIGIYLAPCAGNLCGTVVIAPGASFRFAHPVVAVTDLQHKPLNSLQIDGSDSEQDLSTDGNGESSGWPLQGKRARPGRRQNFVVDLAAPTHEGRVLQLPTIELNDQQVQLPSITLE